MTKHVLLAIGFLFVTAPAVPAAPRADVVAYGDHPLSATLGGLPFAPPLTSCDRASDSVICPAGGLKTLLDYEVVPGLSHPLGTTGWGLATFGKYVLMGNYELGISGLAFGTPPINVADQQIGVFDSEEKTFCVLDLDPQVSALAAVEWIEVATPAQRQSRIYFQGFRSASTGWIFGWIDADLDAEDPCDAETGWQVSGFLPDDLNDAASSLPPEKTPCPGVFSAFCGFDGMQILHHDAATGTDTVLLHNWFTQAIIAATVDGGGALSIVDVHVAPPWQPEEGEGACMNLRPVIQPAVDPTRSLPDLRFTTGFDQSCNIPDGTPGCAPWVGLCPGTGQACSIGSTCPNKVCEVGYADCTSNADCAPFNGNCTDACKLVHPGTRCAASGDPCARDDDCAPGEDCICGPGRPFQEFRFDGATITPTSAHLQTAPFANHHLLGVYDNLGGLWVAKNPYDMLTDPLGEGSQLGIYFKNFFGEHNYYDPANPEGSEIHAPNVLLPFQRPNIFAQPSHAVQLANVMYTTGRDSIERAFSGFGTWARDAGYKAFLGADVLPRQPRSCIGGTRNQKPCYVGADCPGGGCGTFLENSVGDIWKADVVLGGAPRSLWVSPRNVDHARRYGPNGYLVRVPVSALIDDSVSTVRPGAVWTEDAGCASTCNRLWLFAEHDGALKFRVRDDGQWSGWHPLPGNVATAGGVSAIFFAGTVELYGRSTSGLVITSALASALDCAPASCAWTSWQTVPGSPLTDAEPAATVQDFGANPGPVVAIRETDGRVRYARRTNGVWTAWKKAGTGVLTNSAPAIASNPADATGRLWIVALSNSTGEVHYGRVGNGLAWSSWKTGPAKPAEVSAWLTPPQIVWDGTRLRLFAAKQGFPEQIYQVTYDNSDFDAWGKPISLGIATRQPVAALQNGDVNLISYWYTLGTSEQLVR
jgi:hypothetical protein